MERKKKKNYGPEEGSWIQKKISSLATNENDNEKGERILLICQLKVARTFPEYCKDRTHRKT